MFWIFRSSIIVLCESYTFLVYVQINWQTFKFSVVSMVEHLAFFVFLRRFIDKSIFRYRLSKSLKFKVPFVLNLLTLWWIICKKKGAIFLFMCVNRKNIEEILWCSLFVTKPKPVYNFSFSWKFIKFLLKYKFVCIIFMCNKYLRKISRFLEFLKFLNAC